MVFTQAQSSSTSLIVVVSQFSLYTENLSPLCIIFLLFVRFLDQMLAQ
jgi:hypothetical protein